MKSNKTEINIEEFAQYMTDGADMDSLLCYFYEGQIAFLESLNENELREQAELYGFVQDEGE
jgi:hypothetical protein